MDYSRNDQPISLKITLPPLLLPMATKPKSVFSNHMEKYIFFKNLTTGGGASSQLFYKVSTNSVVTLPKPAILMINTVLYISPAPDKTSTGLD